jgi:D-alanyl-D-alanine carboxypeptidase/D-alanyl-D-alanine-endopeptidase (penicillin-binding protein 4)
MRKTLLTHGLLLLFWLNPVFPARPQQPIRPEELGRLEQNLRQTLERLLKDKLFQNTQVGLTIASIGDNRIFYQRRAKVPLMTASALKILPAGVALAKWDPDHRLITPVYMDGFLKDRALYGNLYLIGQGDPSLQVSDLQKAAAAIKSLGIDRIDGDLIYDISFFDEDTNRFAPNARNLYAPACALSVNYNALDVEIDENHPTPKLRLIPETSYARLKYDVHIKKSEKPGRPAMTYEEFPWGDQYAIKGIISDWDKKYHYLCLGVSRPGLFFATLFREALTAFHIEVKGRIKKGLLVAQARELVRMTSAPLKESIKIMNQESSNLIAEMLNKNLGARFASTPGTRVKGLTVIKTFCAKQIGIPVEELFMEDACGLSSQNRLSAAHFIRILNYFYKTPEIKEHFLPSLKEQIYLLQKRPSAVRVLSKSGTLSATGVNTEVGYLIDEQTGQAFSFAILVNRTRPGPMTYSGTLTDPILTAILGAFEGD